MRIPRSDQLPVGVPDHKSGILRVTRIRAFNNAIFIQKRLCSSDRAVFSSQLQPFL